MKALVLVVAFGIAETCGIADTRKGVGESCTRDDQCLESLRCRSGVCTDVGDSGSTNDGSLDAD